MLNPLVVNQEVKLLRFQRYKKASEFHNSEAFYVQTSGFKTTNRSKSLLLIKEKLVTFGVMLAPQ